MSIFGMFTRGVENPGQPLTSATLLEMLGPGGTTDSGVMVTEEGSLSMSAVFRATSLISSLGGALPLHVYEGDVKVPQHGLLDNAHPDLTTYDLWKLSYVHRCLWGNSYNQKIRDKSRRIVGLYPMSPWRMKVGKARKPDPLNPTGKVFEFTKDDGSTVPLTPFEVFHVPALGYDGVSGVSPIRAASQAIGLALAAEKSAAKLFGSGNLLSGLLQTEQRLTQDQAETLQHRWRAKFAGADRAHEVAVLDSGASFQSMTMPSVDAQMLETRDFAVTEIARFFGVPPYLMFQTQRSTSWGTGIEQQATGFVKFDLHPGWLAPTEQRITKELLPEGQRAKYAVEGLLRGDTASRAEFYRVMREVGAFSANDIRELEDRPPVGPEGDILLQPMNMVPLGTEPPDPNEASSNDGNAKDDNAKDDEGNG